MSGDNTILVAKESADCNLEELSQREKTTKKRDVVFQIDSKDEEIMSPIENNTEEDPDYQMLVNVKDIANFKYLDHTADVQLHSWGHTMPEAFSYAAFAIFNYMTPLIGIKTEKMMRDITYSGHDIESLLFSFLYEFLYTFHTNFIACKRIKITEFNKELWKIKAKRYGEIFDREKHECGTEVKAITYNAMQIVDADDNVQIYVIVDV